MSSSLPHCDTFWNFVEGSNLFQLATSLYQLLQLNTHVKLWEEF